MTIKVHCKVCGKEVNLDCLDETPRELDPAYLDKICSWVTCDPCMAMREAARPRKRDPEEPKQAGLPYKD